MLGFLGLSILELRHATDGRTETGAHFIMPLHYYDGGGIIIKPPTYVQTIGDFHNVFIDEVKVSVVSLLYNTAEKSISLSLLV